jgi:IS5 family transposase
MLRIYFLQHWFNLSDPGAEEALYDSRALRAFVGIDLGREPVPDETTLCKFRHLMERHNLGDQLFHLVKAYLRENGLQVARGTIVDALVFSPGGAKAVNRLDIGVVLAHQFLDCLIVLDVALPLIPVFSLPPPTAWRFPPASLR